MKMNIACLDVCLHAKVEVSYCPQQRVYGIYLIGLKSSFVNRIVFPLIVSLN